LGGGWGGRLIGRLGEGRSAWVGLTGLVRGNGGMCRGKKSCEGGEGPLGGATGVGRWWVGSGRLALGGVSWLCCW